MSAKTCVMIFFTIGTLLGSYLPNLFGIGAFSYTSLLAGAGGGAIGIVIGYKISQNL